MDHPDRAYCKYLVEGLRDGFRIGFQHGQVACRNASSNMQSANAHPEVVSDFLSSEFRAGRVRASWTRLGALSDPRDKTRKTLHSW